MSAREALTVRIDGAKLDWLVHDVQSPTQLIKTDKGTLRLTNGLIHREFLVTPDFATVDYYSYERKSSLLRAMGPEAVITLDDKQYNIGGILTNIPRAYLNRTALAHDMSENPNAFHYAGYSTAVPEAPFKYTPKRGAPKDIVWPPKGLRLDVTFKAPTTAPAIHQQVQVIIHYEMYDGIPVMAKWLSFNASDEAKDKVLLSVDTLEYVAVNWDWSPKGFGWFLVESNEPHGFRINWFVDPLHMDMPGSFQQIVTVTYYLPPKLPIREFPKTFRVHELVHGSSDPERVGLARRKKLRVLAPHTQENPIFFHMTNKTSEAVRDLVDQLAEVGFEMLIYSFRIGFQYETDDPRYIAKIAADVAYAKSKGIEVGGWDLICWTRKVKEEWMADTRVPLDGACFASGWYDYLLERILNFMDKTGLTMIETDGPYAGYPCHSTNHSHHHGYQDSIYKQMLLQEKFYTIMQERGVYTNQPDEYFYFGGSKTVMGYKERQFSLPRWQDLSLSRQGMYDNMYHYTPTVGWMFMPFVVYHGGGDAAMFEPLSEHIQEYEWGLAQYFGAGVGTCYRGYRLYDSEETKAIATKWVSFYKKYRDILISDVIHVHRPDMQSIDCFMHVNPRLENRALAMVFNPTHEKVATNLTLPLYYSGLTTMAKVSEQGLSTESYLLDRDYTIDVPIYLPALGITWFLIQEEIPEAPSSAETDLKTLQK